jgi:toxin ParE1/3/4
MQGVRLTDLARQDLSDIWDYVSQHSQASADNLIIEITKKFATLRNFPNTGKEQSHLLINLRSFPYKDYQIFYQQFDEGIEILRVLHRSRDIESLFENFFDAL